MASGIILAVGALMLALGKREGADVMRDAVLATCVYAIWLACQWGVEYAAYLAGLPSGFGYAENACTQALTSIGITWAIVFAAYVAAAVANATSFGSLQPLLQLLGSALHILMLGAVGWGAILYLLRMWQSILFPVLITTAVVLMCIPKLTRVGLALFIQTILLNGLIPLSVVLTVSAIPLLAEKMVPIPGLSTIVGKGASAIGFTYVLALPLVLLLLAFFTSLSIYIARRIVGEGISISLPRIGL